MRPASGSSPSPRWVQAALDVVALAWVGLRLAAPTTTPPPAVTHAFETVRVVESTESGRFELREWPDVLERLDLSDLSEAQTAGNRLEAAVQEANDTLAGLARLATGQVERAPDGPAALRLAGMLVEFPPADAERLSALVDADPERCVETLSVLARLLDARLEQPPKLEPFDETVQRRELTRLHRDVRDALSDAEKSLDAATIAFREEAISATRRAGGPFLRRGRGVALETVAAALLGVLLREALRRRRGRVDAIVSVPIAPAAAFAAVTALSGSAVLPVHPVYGLSPVFVPLAFAAGWLTPGALTILSRADRLFSDENDKPAAPPPPPPILRQEERRAPVVPISHGAGERAPFFRKRR